jgi:hypothetical protein
MAEMQTSSGEGEGDGAAEGGGIAATVLTGLFSVIS